MQESLSPVPETDLRKLTGEERRRERIRQLKNRIQRETSLLSTQARKTRNGQLISLGVMVEAAYRNGDPEQRRTIREWAEKYLTDERNRVRVEAGFDRLGKETNAFVASEE